MKHLYESVFDSDFDGDFPWMKMKHWEDYYDLLKKMTKHKLSNEMIDHTYYHEYVMAGWRNLGDFMSLISRYNTRITSGNYSKNGCYAFCKRDDYGNDDMFVIDLPRNLRISFRRSNGIASIYAEPNNGWIPVSANNIRDWGVYRIDPALVVLIKYVLS